MDYNSNLDIEIYSKKENININLTNVVDGYIYDLELVKKVKTSPTSYLFVFEYPEDIRKIIEVDLFSAFLFLGTHDNPKVPGYWNGSLLDEEDLYVKRKYTPIHIDTDNRLVHFLIRIYSPTEEFPDGGKLTRYIDQFLPTETLSITSWKPKIKLIKENLIKVLGTKVEFDTLNLAAGGTGITPFIRILNYYQDLPFNINLIYSNRSFDEILLKPLLDKFTSINKRLKITYLVTRENKPKEEEVICSKVTEEILLSKFSNTDKAICLFCGPPGFNDLLFDLLQKLKFKHIHRV